jgi:hypothetical protein
MLVGLGTLQCQTCLQTGAGRPEEPATFCPVVLHTLTARQTATESCCCCWILQALLHVWLEVLTAVTMKMAVFWVAAPCRPVSEVCTVCAVVYRPDVGGSNRHLKRRYTVLQPRRQPTPQPFYSLLFCCLHACAQVHSSDSVTPLVFWLFVYFPAVSSG